MIQRAAYISRSNPAVCVFLLGVLLLGPPLISIACIHVLKTRIQLTKALIESGRIEGLRLRALLMHGEAQIVATRKRFEAERKHLQEIVNASEAKSHARSELLRMYTTDNDAIKEHVKAMESMTNGLHLSHSYSDSGTNVVIPTMRGDFNLRTLTNSTSKDVLRKYIDVRKHLDDAMIKIQDSHSEVKKLLESKKRLLRSQSIAMVKALENRDILQKKLNATLSLIEKVVIESANLSGKNLEPLDTAVVDYEYPGHEAYVSSESEDSWL
ncbi:hypothetical protein AAMO2058_000403200 [Amorphochlora amoebiformis]